MTACLTYDPLALARTVADLSDRVNRLAALTAEALHLVADAAAFTSRAAIEEFDREMAKLLTEMDGLGEGS
jgi:hypothetical protein